MNAKGDFRAEEEYILPSKIQQMCSDASTEESNFDYSRENGLCCDHLKHDADWKLAQCTSGSGIKIVSRVNCLLGICSHMSAVTAQHPKCLKVYQTGKDYKKCSSLMNRMCSSLSFSSFSSSISL